MEERLKCETRKLRALKDLKNLNKFQLLKGLFWNDLNKLNEINQKSWEKLKSRHDPNIFPNERPRYLNLKFADFIVTESCMDIHTILDIKKDEEELLFFFDIVPIIEEFIIALLLAQSKKFKEIKEENFFKIEMLTSIINPINQVAFTFPEMKFFIEQFTEHASKLKTWDVKLMKSLLHITEATTLIAKWSGAKHLEYASWTANTALYWSNIKDTQHLEFMDHVKESLILIERGVQDQKPTTFMKELYKIWHRNFIEPIKDKISGALLATYYEFMTRVKSILKPLFQLILTFTLFLPSVIEVKILTVFLQFILADWLFADSSLFVISRLFRYVLPWKESYKFNERTLPFIPNEWKRIEKMQNLRTEIWTMVTSEQQGKPSILKEDANDLKNRVRCAYNQILSDYVLDHYDHLNLNDDLFFETLLMYRHEYSS